MNSRTRLAWHAGDPVLPLAPDEVHVWVAAVAEHADPRLLAEFRKLLSNAELSRLERLATAALRQEFLVTRALCRQALSLHAGVPPADWSFQTNAFGCPAVLAPAAAQTLRFNLSNTNTMVACAVAQTVDVGVDVECWNRPGDVMPIGVRAVTDPLCHPGADGHHHHRRHGARPGLHPGRASEAGCHAGGAEVSTLNRSTVRTTAWRRAWPR